jgi:hypothetical protein
MLRTLLAVTALLVFSQPALASRNFDVPQGQEKAYSAFSVEVRRAMTAAVYAIEGAGGAEVVIDFQAGGKFKIVSVKASDEQLEQRTRAEIAKIRLPRPPSWVVPLRLTMKLSFRK